MNLKELGKRVLKAGAPKLGMMLGGPLGAVAAGMLAKRLDVDSDDPAALDAALNEMNPDMAMLDKEMAHDLQMAQTEAMEKIDLAQIDANKQAAKSGSLFVAGARPAVIWTGVMALNYHFLLRPMLNGISNIFRDACIVEKAVVACPPFFPDIDIAGIVSILGGVLGFGTMRMWEGLKGVKRNNLSEK